MCANKLQLNWIIIDIASQSIDITLQSDDITLQSVDIT